MSRLYDLSASFFHYHGSVEAITACKINILKILVNDAIKYNNHSTFIYNIIKKKYEEKIINLIKSKIKLNIKEIDVKEAEKIISDFNKPNMDKSQSSKARSSNKEKVRTKKISKK